MSGGKQGTAIVIKSKWQYWLDHQRNLCFKSVNAMMTFEEENMTKACQALKELESKCAYNLSWFKAVKTRVFGSSEMGSPYDLLEQQIILADCHVCQAFLNMIMQDSTASYVKGGWLLKKAWSLYLSVYSNISVQYKKCFGSEINLVPPGRKIVVSKSIGFVQTCSERQSNTSMVHSISSMHPIAGSKESINISNIPDDDEQHHHYYDAPDVQTLKNIPESQNPTDIARLTRAVCFGYGLFHLCVSLLPPSVLRFISLIGFVGDRVAGLKSLEFARQGPDVRAPLATIALLWYYTIINPLLALEPGDIVSTIQCADIIMEDSKKEFANSALFYFFKGRIFRLKNEVNSAVGVYTAAINLSGQRELSLLCLHEVGWCRLMQLDFQSALHAFSQLKEQSRWSRVFYTYLSAVCCGCINEMHHVAHLTQILKQKSKMRFSQLDQLILHRLVFLMPTKTPHFYRLLAYEMLYLWNSMPGKEGLNSILNDIESNAKSLPSKKVMEPMVGLSALLAGVCLTYLNRDEEAVSMLASVRMSRIEEEKRYKSRADLHISAFALYEIGMICFKKKKMSDAKLVLDSIVSVYTNYDFEHRLKMKIQTTLKAIQDCEFS
ncbi:tetratricopeptide repeat protein 39C-like isoform X2 [Cimex lectularius]|uniref:Tetratricopeptide repeat protein 39C n=1 Tax=Cimex lectularius TaxID=79782 RepID=A0A8I6RRD8_CIMLE|nr:tetratricopeptide repeat protein 39C-like isoform X2 [Cimex lectularius]